MIGLKESIIIMERYKNIHKWMILPFVLVLSGFITSYFMTWTTEPWGYHLHALSAMAWFVFLMYVKQAKTHQASYE